MIKFLVVILSITSVSWAKYSNYSTYSNYNNGMNQGYFIPPQQKIDPAKILNKKLTILNDLKKAVGHNHQICGNHQECLNLDQQSLRQFQQKYRDSYEMQDFFQDLTQKMKQSVDADIAVTELDVYKSMPDSVKQQYMEGVRMNDPRQAVNKLTAKYGMNSFTEASEPSNSKAKFNVEDLKIYLLQQIEENHEECGSRDSCLRSDLKIVADVAQNLKETDPGLGEFKQLAVTMKRHSSKRAFDTIRFFDMYRDALVNQYSMLYKSPERLQWIALVKNIDIIRTRDPHIIDAAKVQEKAKPENKMKQELKQKGTDLANGLLDQLVGGTSSDQKGQGLFGGLFGK